MGKSTKAFLIIAIIFSLIFCAWLTARIVKDVQFNNNCEQYLKRAADANTVETAKEELAKAISYAERNNLTQGIVSIFLKQPKNDIGFWYKNLTESYEELNNISEEASQLEKTNVLMKLRETLTDYNDNGVSVTLPNGIEIYPNNVLYFWWSLISGILCFAFWIMFLVAWLNYWD